MTLIYTHLINTHTPARNRWCSVRCRQSRMCISWRTSLPQRRSRRCPRVQAPVQSSQHAKFRSANTPLTSLYMQSLTEEHYHNQVMSYESMFICVDVPCLIRHQAWSQMQAQHSSATIGVFQHAENSHQSPSPQQSLENIYEHFSYHQT